MEPLIAPENRRHYPGLDGLRAVAVLMVLAQHYLTLSPAITWGWAGVRIFFVLSGFLITGILYDTRNAERRWSVFYARRALRIFPLYYGVLALGLLLHPIYRWVVHPSWVLWPFYLQNYSRFFWPAAANTGVLDHLRSTRYTHPVILLHYGHFWSLAVEEQFYLVWPLVVFAIRRRETLMRICIAVVAILPFVRFLCAFLLPTYLLSAGFEDRCTPLQCDSLLLCGFLALWLRGSAPNLTLIAKRTLLILLTLLAAAELLCWVWLRRPVYPSDSAPIFASFGYTAVNLGCASLVLLAIDPSTSFSRILRLRPLRWLGTISYGFYVFHDMPSMYYSQLTDWLHLWNPRGLTTMLIALLGTLLLASASFYGFERPFLRLKDRFTIPAQHDDRSTLRPS